MNAKIRTSSRPVKASSKKMEEKMDEKTQIEEGRTMTDGSPPGLRSSRRERKIHLEKTSLKTQVDQLRKRLRREENIHRALQRAFNRPLGSFPRLPPYLPSKMVELLAEVAVLEEEVVRLEDQVINFWLGIYQEAAQLSSSSKNKPKSPPPAASVSDQNPQTCLRNKEKTHLQPQFSNIRARSGKNAQPDHITGPNKISEELLRCLIMIFSTAAEPSEPSISGKEDIILQDPYKLSTELEPRDVGACKRFVSLDARVVSAAIAAAPPSLFRRLRFLLRKLGSVNLRGLTHRSKLAFWVNVYNSCMMNAFLEKGIPSTPQTVALMMQKAKIDVGGRVISAIWIEHFILRLPRNHPSTRIDRERIGGLEQPEPFVTFALACGSWSSPAVRIYTAAKVEDELLEAKREYLQASVSTSCALGIPRLLNWYMVDFAEDIDSFAKWIFLQLPSELRNDTVDFIRIIPYDFTFRYLLAL